MCFQCTSSLWLTDRSNSRRGAFSRTPHSNVCPDAESSECDFAQIYISLQRRGTSANKLKIYTSCVVFVALHGMCISHFCRRVHSNCRRVFSQEPLTHDWKLSQCSLITSWVGSELEPPTLQNICATFSRLRPGVREKVNSILSLSRSFGTPR